MSAVVRPVVVPSSRTWLGTAAMGAAIAAAVIVSTTSDSDDGIVLCPFRRCTGAYCPGCGGTRAAGRLLRGDLLGAWHRHPFVVLLAVQAAVLVAVAAVPTTRSRLETLRLPLIVANTALLLAIWLVRVGLGDIPTIF